MTQPGRPRLDPRVRVSLRIDVTPRWEGGAPVTMETLDVSPSGAAILSPINLPLKTQVSVRIHLPGFGGRAAADLTCESVVVNVEEIGHARRQWRAGIYFLAMPEPARAALQRFVYAALEASFEAERAGASQG